MQQVVSLADRKRKLINFLKDKTYIRIGLSPRGGVGIIATQEIPMNINPFVTNVDPSNSETIDLMKSEIDRLPMHVRDIITHFIIPHVEGGVKVWPVPEKGFNRLDSSWYVNYPSVGEEPSIMLTRRKDSTGYTNMRSCKCIQEDEELLLDYTTPPPLGPAATAATAAFICYICQSEVDKNAPGCVNLRCKCVHSYMHQECADKWFEPRLKLTVSRLSREDQEITCEVTCEMCGASVGDEYIDALTERICNPKSDAAGDNGSSSSSSSGRSAMVALVRKVREHADGRRAQVAVRLGALRAIAEGCEAAPMPTGMRRKRQREQPSPQSQMQTQSQNESKTPSKTRSQNSTPSKTSQSASKTPQSASKGLTDAEVLARASSSARAAGDKAGPLTGRKAKIWWNDPNMPITTGPHNARKRGYWDTSGVIGSYISAEDRNKTDGANVHTRGMYKYWCSGIKVGPKRFSEDYFSEDDETIVCIDED